MTRLTLQDSLSSSEDEVPESLLFFLEAEEDGEETVEEGEEDEEGDGVTGVEECGEASKECLSIRLKSPSSSFSTKRGSMDLRLSFLRARCGLSLMSTSGS